MVIPSLAELNKVGAILGLLVLLFKCFVSLYLGIWRYLKTYPKRRWVGWIGLVLNFFVYIYYLLVVEESIYIIWGWGGTHNALWLFVGGFILFRRGVVIFNCLSLPTPPKEVGEKLWFCIWGVILLFQGVILFVKIRSHTNSQNLLYFLILYSRGERGYTLLTTADKMGWLSDSLFIFAFFSLSPLLSLPIPGKEFYYFIIFYIICINSTLFFILAFKVEEGGFSLWFGVIVWGGLLFYSFLILRRGLSLESFAFSSQIAWFLFRVVWLAFLAIVSYLISYYNEEKMGVGEFWKKRGWSIFVVVSFTLQQIPCNTL